MYARHAGLMVAAWLSGSVALAHHSWTVDYTAGDIVELEGEVVEVWYASPHARIVIEVANEDGTRERWEAESWPASVLARRGWTYDHIKVGDVVRMAGERAKEGRRGLHLQTISRPSDGWEAFVGLGTPDNFSLGN